MAGFGIPGIGASPAGNYGISSGRTASPMRVGNPAASFMGAGGKPFGAMIGGTGAASLGKPGGDDTNFGLNFGMKAAAAFQSLGEGKSQPSTGGGADKKSDKSDQAKKSSSQADQKADSSKSNSKSQPSSSDSSKDSASKPDDSQSQDASADSSGND